MRYLESFNLFENMKVDDVTFTKEGDKLCFNYKGKKHIYQISSSGLDLDLKSLDRVSSGEYTGGYKISVKRFGVNYDVDLSKTRTLDLMKQFKDYFDKNGGPKPEIVSIPKDEQGRKFTLTFEEIR